jgi:protein involved in polysaccharide export with SLBB domain
MTLRIRALVVMLSVLSSIAVTRKAFAQQLESTPTPVPERRSDEEMPRTATGTTPITVRPFGETEIYQPERSSTAAQGVPLSPPLDEPLDPDKYVCDRGDTFELNFWGQQNFKLRITVDLEGRAFISKVGYLNIAGKTLTVARSMVAAAIHRYYPGLNFGMSLVGPRHFLVQVAGYVKRPGTYVAGPLRRVAHVLQDAGGISGSRRRIDIRHRDGTHVTADLVLYEITGDVKYNPFVMDGDVVDVPYSELTVEITGAVRRPGSFELIATKDFSELLALAGGFRNSVTRQLPIRLLHHNKAEHLEVTKIEFPGDAGVPNFPLHDQDEIGIPSTSELQRSILIIGPVAGASSADEVTTVRRFPYFEGATVRAVVEGTGGFGASSDLKASYVKHENGEITYVDLERVLVLRDFSADRNVEIGDTVVIPQKRRAVTVDGAVFHSGIYPYKPEFHLSEYLAVAGGVTKNAMSPGNFRLVTSAGKTIRLSNSTRIEPGDSITIPERTFSRSEVVQLVMGGVGLLISAVSLAVLVSVRVTQP